MTTLSTLYEHEEGFLDDEIMMRQTSVVHQLQRFFIYVYYWRMMRWVFHSEPTTFNQAYFRAIIHEEGSGGPITVEEKKEEMKFISSCDICLNWWALLMAASYSFCLLLVILWFTL